MLTDEMKVSYQIEHTEGTAPFAVMYHETVLISSTITEQYLTYNYGEFLCSDLHNKFLLYNSMQAADLKKALDAWNATYNPLENYNGVIDRVTTDTHGDETRTHKTGGEGGTHNKVTSAALANTATTHETTTYDSTALRTESKDSNTGGTETTDDLHTEDKTTHATVNKTVGDTTYSGDEVHTEREDKHGNLGVTTSQQMIMSEAEMRLNPVIKQYLDRFIYQYAIYVGSTFEAWERW